MQTRVVTKTIPDNVPALSDAAIVEIAEILNLLGEASRLRILLACLSGVSVRSAPPVRRGAHEEDCRP